jgi:hypothetical protein
MKEVTDARKFQFLYGAIKSRPNGNKKTPLFQGFAKIKNPIFYPKKLSKYNHTTDSALRQ